MANITARKQQSILADSLVKSTHFCKFEIECMLRYFKELTKNKLDRTGLRDILHNSFRLTDDIIMDRVFKTFDQDNDSYVSMEEWVRGLSVFLRGTIDERMAFCFGVYDLNNDGILSKEEMTHLMHRAVTPDNTGDEDPEEGVKELVDIAVKQLDQDHDNRVCFSDYKAAVSKDYLLLETFGQCLPNESDVNNFLTILQSDYSHSNREII